MQEPWNALIKQNLSLVRTLLAKQTAYSCFMKNLCGFCLSIFLVSALPHLCHAQDLEPRRWSHLPTGTNFTGGGYSYTEADIFLDPILRIEDVTMEMHSLVIKYIRTFALLEKSARIDFTQGFHEGRWKGLVDGVPESIKRSGLSDSILRFAINLYGAPPLEHKEFAAYRAKVDNETIVGTALAVHLPTGEYMDDKLINLGNNRFTFRPQLGVVHNRGKWSMEITGAAWLYTKNDDFFNGNELEQDPLYTIQAHIVYTFPPGLWSSAGIGYAYGSESTLNGEEKNDRKGNLVWAFSLGYPINRQLGIKAVYLCSRSQESVGQDSDSIAVALSILW